MTPEEKAKDLIEKFEPHADWNNEYGSAEKQANRKHAKECARIAVNEILAAFVEPGVHWTVIKKWREVQAAIEVM